MSVEPLISVMMPVYNHEQYVQGAIRSIINQTYHNIELIIIDDGSKDASWQKIQEMRAECEGRFARVYMETKKNEGICLTFNRLLSLAKGEYTYLIASDDLSIPHAIERLLKEIQSGDFILATGNEHFIDAEGNQIGCDKNFSSLPLEMAPYKTFCDFYIDITGKDLYHSNEFGSYSSLLVRNYIPNGSLVRAEFMKKVVFYKEIPLEDWYMHLQLSKMGKYKFVDDILFLYRLHGTNTILNKERLMQMSQATLSYERKMYEKSPAFAKIFESVFVDRYYLNLGFIQIYKKKYLRQKEYCLNIFGKEFIWHKRLK